MMNRKLESNNIETRSDTSFLIHSFISIAQNNTIIVAQIAVQKKKTKKPQKTTTNKKHFHKYTQTKT